jgi:hypothetical protein
MRRQASAVMTVGTLVALFVTVPRWTAGRAEARRQAAFDDSARRAIPRDLPFCPAPGPQRDAFLEHSAAAFTSSSNLWIPVCRIAPLPVHRVLLMAATRAELSHCWANADSRRVSACVLDEPLGLLADPKAARTWARREGGEAIWLTSRPMAWQEHLIAEHRQWMTLSLLFPTIAAFFVFGVRRTRYAFSMCAASRSPGDPDLPRNAELALHWVLGRRCHSLPGDLSEEYSGKLENGFPPQEADRWYRWQVFHSIAPVAARRIQAALTGKTSRNQHG